MSTLRNSCFAHLVRVSPTKLQPELWLQRDLSQEAGACSSIRHEGQLIQLAPNEADAERCCTSPLWPQAYLAGLTCCALLVPLRTVQVQLGHHLAISLNALCVLHPGRVARLDSTALQPASLHPASAATASQCQLSPLLSLACQELPLPLVSQ